VPDARGITWPGWRGSPNWTNKFLEASHEWTSSMGLGRVCNRGSLSISSQRFKCAPIVKITLGALRRRLRQLHLMDERYEIQDTRHEILVWECYTNYMDDCRPRALILDYGAAPCWQTKFAAGFALISRLWTQKTRVADSSLHWYLYLASSSLLAKFIRRSSRLFWCLIEFIFRLPFVMRSWALSFEHRII